MTEDKAREIALDPVSSRAPADVALLHFSKRPRELVGGPSVLIVLRS
jgi:hypothetical protein